MAARNGTLLYKNNPPRQSEGYLTVKKQIPPTIPYRKSYYCVLFGDVLQLFDNKKSYESKKQNPKAQIDLQQVCSISETVQALKGQKTNTEFCFKVEQHNQNEVVFSAKSKEEVKCWVDCLKHTKLFYENWSASRGSIKNQSSSDANAASLKKEESDPANEIKHCDIDPSDISLSIIMSHGPKYTAYMKSDGDIEDLWTAALKWLPGHYCEKCENCRLRRSTMELWSVDKKGNASKVDKHFTDLTNKELYLLEHNYKLLVVHFEDSTFLVSPADMSIKSKEVPEIELFARKLTSIECNNAQLYLVTSSHSVTLPFSPDEQPLTDYFWERRGNEWSHRDRKGDKLLLKSRALIIPRDSHETAEKCQELKAKRMFEERRQKIAIKEIEKNQVHKKAWKNMAKAIDTVSGFPVEWSTDSTNNLSMSKTNSKNFKPCFGEVPCKVPTSDVQKTAPFVYMSDDETSDCIIKERRSSEGYKRKQEEVVVKRRTTSESDARIHRKGAIKHRNKTQKQLLPSIKATEKSNENFGNKERERTPDNISSSENIDPVPSSPIKHMSLSHDSISSENILSSESIPSNASGPSETSVEIASKSDCERVAGFTQESDSCMKSNRHCCSYYRVESPCILKPILEQYGRLKKGEEEVDSSDPPKNLCFSSVHLVNKDNHWVIEKEENLSLNNNEFDNCDDVFFLPPDIKVIFDTSRTWIVQRIQRDVNDTSENDNSSLTNNELNVDMFLSSKQTVCPELTMLDNAIQKIFLVEGLDDTKSPNIRNVVCLDFCSALYSILIHGLGTRRTLFGIVKYTLWEVVDAMTASTTPKEGSAVLQKINRLGVREDRLHLELFVCECLNKGNGALAEWFEWFLRQKETLKTFYSDGALVRSENGPSDVVQKLSRLTFLPFHLTYFDEIKEKLKKESLTTFSFE